jgi:hypothetical protein
MSTPTNPAELPPPLEAVLGQIRAALTPGADAATKGAAAHACRVLLGVFEAQPGQPLQVPIPPPMPPVAPVAPTMDAPIDRFLARIVDKFGGDLPAADPSVPFVNLGHVSALFAQFGGLGGVR